MTNLINNAITNFFVQILWSCVYLFKNYSHTTKNEKKKKKKRKERKEKRKRKEK